MPPRNHGRRVEVMWCPNTKGKKGPGWSFPRTVERYLVEFTAGRSVLQLFGGQSAWGWRLDIDRTTRPHVIGDAWLPPFRKNAVDVVILDPPYTHINAQQKTQLLQHAAYTARQHVIWFHTLWIYASPALPPEREFLVRVGDNCACRCLQVFRVKGPKRKPDAFYTRGPAMKYNRWLNGQAGLPLEREA